jgi:hypothetical protein
MGREAKLTEGDVLRAVAAARHGHLEGESDYEGPLTTIQGLAAHFRVSDSTARKAVLSLYDQGRLRIFDGRDPDKHCRRLFIAPL